jgi:hypothetical protein
MTKGTKRTTRHQIPSVTTVRGRIYAPHGETGRRAEEHAWCSIAHLGGRTVPPCTTPTHSSPQNGSGRTLWRIHRTCSSERSQPWPARRCSHC